MAANDITVLQEQADGSLKETLLNAFLARKVEDYGPPTWVRTSSRDNSAADVGIVAAISWDGIVWHSTTKSKLFPANSFSRDASVFWHQPTSRWVCFSTDAFGGTKSFQVATSPDLRTWTVITVPLVGPLTAGTANNTWLNHHFIDNGNYYALARLSTTAGNNYGAPGCGYTRCLNPGTWTQWTNWTPFDSTVRVDANEMCIIKKGDLYHMFSLPGTHLNLTPPGLPNFYDIHVQTSTQPFGGYSAPVNVTASARAELGTFFIEGCDIVHIKGDHYRLYFQEGVNNEAWAWDSYDGMQTWDLESLRALQYIGLDGRGHGTVTRATTQNIRSIQSTIRQLAEPSPHTHRASEISDSTAEGRALLTAATVQAQRTALETFVSAANLTAIQALTGNFQRVYIAQDTRKIYVWSGTGSVYTEISPFPPVELIAACSDDISPLTSGNSKVTFRTPCAFELTGVKASVNTAPVGSPLVVDINKNGTSVLSTKLSIDAGETTSVTAAIPPVLIATTFASDDIISVDIDQAVGNQAGTGLKVTVIGIRH